MAKYVFSASGSDTWTAPSDGYVQIEGWGGGGGTHNHGTLPVDGAGGGAYAFQDYVLMSLGDSLLITVGSPGVCLSISPYTDVAGGDSIVTRNSDSKIVLVAKGGQPGTTDGTGSLGGQASECIGYIRRSGGNGAPNDSINGGGGGGSANDMAMGNDGYSTTGGARAPDDIFDPLVSPIVSSSGAGGNGDVGTIGAFNGLNPAGGAGGQGSNGSGGYSGGNGTVIVYFYPFTEIPSTADTSIRLPAMAKQVDLSLWGSGGGGGGSNGTGQGSGGGGGAETINHLIAGQNVNFGFSITSITIARGGTGGLGGSLSLNGGFGTSTFVTIPMGITFPAAYVINAGGGAGGFSNHATSFGTGGVASNGDVNLNGSDGTADLSQVTKAGDGGSSPNGGATDVGTLLSNNQTGNAPGGGGAGGGSAGNSGAGGYGGAGADGALMLALTISGVNVSGGVFIQDNNDPAFTGTGMMLTSTALASSTDITFTFNYTPSGNLILAGTSLTRRRFNVSSTGKVILKGSSVSNILFFSVYATGKIILNGSSISNIKGYVVYSSGKMTLNGSSLANIEYASFVEIPTGQIILGGFSNIKGRYDMYGGFILSGIANERTRLKFKSLGGAVLGDSAITGITHYYYIPNSGVIFTDNSIIQVSKNYNSTGKLTLKSSSLAEVEQTYLSGGNLILAGTPILRMRKRYTSGGILILEDTVVTLPNLLTVASGGVILSSTAIYLLNNDYLSSGELILGSTVFYIPRFTVIGNATLKFAGSSKLVIEQGMQGGGTLHLGSQAIANIGSFIVSQDFIWDVYGIIEKDFTFTWDVGQQILYYYTINGTCLQAPSCSTAGLSTSDPVCASGTSRFMQIIAARSLTDLCIKMRQLYLNWPVQWPIASIQKSSRPVYLSDVNYNNDPTATIYRLTDGTLIQTSTVNGQIIVTTRFTNGTVATKTQASISGSVIIALPDGAIVQVVITGGIVKNIITTKPNGLVTTQNANSLLVLPSKGAQTTTIADQINQQLSTLPENCNTLTEQEYCHIPECLQFCITEDLMASFTASVFYQDTFLPVEIASGGFVLSGFIETILDTNNSPTGGFSLGDSSIVVSSAYSYAGSGTVDFISNYDISLQNVTYFVVGQLNFAGNSEIASSAFSWNPSGTLNFASQAISRQKLTYSPSGGFFISNSSLFNVIFYYLNNMDGGFLINGSSIVGCDFYNYISIGEMELGGDILISSSSWNYEMNLSNVLSGFSLIKYRTEMSGALISGDSAAVSLVYSVSSNGNISLSGSFVILSSPNWSYIPGGNIFLVGEIDTHYYNLGDFNVDFSAGSILDVFEPVFSDDAGILPTLVADTGFVTNSPCSCGRIPITLQLQHNLGSTTVLGSFLIRNGLTLPTIVNLTYNKYDGSWREVYHFNGTGTESFENWHILFNWNCSPTIEGSDTLWNLSILISRIKNLSPIEKFETRILYGFNPTDVCDNNNIDFSFKINTNSGQVTSPPSIIIPESILTDDIGLFAGTKWGGVIQMTIANIIAPSTVTSQNIFSIFPQNES